MDNNAIKGVTPWLNLHSQASPLHFTLYGGVKNHEKTNC